VLKIFNTMNELAALDDQVNEFIQKNRIGRVISVSDVCTLDSGNTCGIIRVLTYQTS
jgi:hypothetical protein